MKPKPFEIILEFTPQSTKTGITYEMHQKGSLIRCKDCEDYKAFKNGGFHHYCETIGCVVYDDDFCCWAERKEESK